MQIFFMLALFVVNSLYSTDFLINEIGIYSLGDNIISLPSGSTNSINIMSSYVTLDLADHIIMQGNSQSSVDAIVINSNVSDVTIKNGTIMDFTGNGIIINSGCANIQLENIKIQNCGARGISFLGAASPNTISNCHVINCEIMNCCNGTASDYAISFSSCLAIDVSNCIISNCGSSGRSLSAMRMEGTISQGFIFDNIWIMNNVGSSFVGVDFDLNDGMADVLRSLFIIDNSSISGSFTGFNLDGSNSVANALQLYDCLVLNNVAAINFTGFREVKHSVFNKNCKAIGNLGTGLVVGFQHDAATSSNIASPAATIHNPVATSLSLQRLYTGSRESTESAALKRSSSPFGIKSALWESALFSNREKDQWHSASKE